MSEEVQLLFAVLGGSAVGGGIGLAIARMFVFPYYDRKMRDAIRRR